MEAHALAILGLGFLLGLKHATDADHVVAVTTFVSGQRNVFRSCWLGAFWGLGHTLSISIAGLMVIGLKINLSPSTALKLEMGVAAMLVGLGARVMVHRHHGQGRWHTHMRPFLVGMVHGAAGSAALMLLVLSTIRTTLEAVVYIAVFGIGTIVGMLIVSLLIALPLRWAAVRLATGYRGIQLASGAFSCMFGIYLGWEVWQRF